MEGRFTEIIAIGMTVIGGAVWIGNLQGQLSALNPESIKKEKNKAISEIKLLYSDIDKSEIIELRNKITLILENKDALENKYNKNIQELKLRISNKITSQYLHLMKI